MKNIIGRKEEIRLLQEAMDSNRSELIAVYGRRRVGKTFLIKEFFNNKFDFHSTGIFEGKQNDELLVFASMLHNDNTASKSLPSDWMEAFVMLKTEIGKLRKKKIVIFLDEFPWFDVPPGRFLKAFEWFWNDWASSRGNIKLIVCGSATTWMNDKFILSKGGLYNRVTLRIHLKPFNLQETQSMLYKQGLQWSPNRILDTYMILGGIPFYLDMLKRGKSLEENIDNMFFHEGAPLKEEYRFLFRSLFKDWEYYIGIIEAISQRNQGVTRKEILSAIGKENTGGLTSALNNLINCDFIRKYKCFGKNERDALYQIIDPFLLFYKRFVEKYEDKDENYWRNSLDSPARRTWSGIAFEQVCLLHIAKIKEALGISGMETSVNSWYFQGNDELSGAQIDLLIVRRDKTINICEMKYSSGPYVLTKRVLGEIKDKMNIFRTATNTKYSLVPTFISPEGLKTNTYSHEISRVVTLEDIMD